MGEIELGGGAWVKPGDSVILHGSLINQGNYTDTYHLEVWSEKSWTLHPTEAVELAIGATQVFTYTVHPPGGVEVGESDRTFFVATSQLDPSYRIMEEQKVFILLPKYFPLVLK
jgi:hypothetical protein